MTAAGSTIALDPRVAESPSAAACRLQFFDDHQVGHVHRQKDHLSDAVARADLKGLRSAVDYGAEDLARVVAVDDADAVGKVDPRPRGQAAAGKEKSPHVGARKLDGDPRGDQSSLTGQKRPRLLDARGQIQPGGPLGRVPGQGDRPADQRRYRLHFHLDLHIVHPF